MGTFKLLCRDVIEALRPLPPNLFHGALCDPPYGLKFMGKAWDHGVPGKEYWSEVLRVLKPGAPILAFGGTRTFHRLACAIEDAGFEIFDSILGSVWVYGQGMPKGINISKAIDKAAGATREIVESRTGPRPGTHGGGGKYGHGDDRSVSRPATEQAKTWEGYFNCLKPSWEPVVCARKPLSGYAENCIEHGCGGLNIDETRIGTEHRFNHSAANKRAPSFGGSSSLLRLDDEGGRSCAGRYPANLILSHHPDCSPLGTHRVSPRGGDIKPNSKGSGRRSNQVYGADRADRGEWTAYKGEDGLEEVEAWECHPECPVAALDRQSERTKSTGGRAGGQLGASGIYYGRMERAHAGGLGDTGGASRFFYCAKVSTAERNAGGVTNRHSTLKPLALTTYLARIILPPPRISSRLLVPFCGTGSEIAGALIAGWSHVVGIDNDPESISTAQDRIPGLITRGTK